MGSPPRLCAWPLPRLRSCASELVLSLVVLRMICAARPRSCYCLLVILSSSLLLPRHRPTLLTSLSFTLFSFIICHSLITSSSFPLLTHHVTPSWFLLLLIPPLLSLLEHDTLSSSQSLVYIILNITWTRQTCPRSRSEPVPYSLLQSHSSSVLQLLDEAVAPGGLRAGEWEDKEGCLPSRKWPSG